MERSILSVAKQRKHRPLDYIIVDGASTDATSAIAERYGQVVTRFVSEPDQGIYDAMNKGLARARCDFVYFLGADDCLADERVLADVAASLDAAPCDFLYGGIEVHFLDGRVVPFMPPPPEDALAFMIHGCLPHQASFASRRAFEAAGVFDTRYRIAGDYDWFLRVLTRDSLVTRRIERTIASYQIGGVSNRLRPSQAEVLRESKRLAALSASRLAEAAGSGVSARSRDAIAAAWIRGLAARDLFVCRRFGCCAIWARGRGSSGAWRSFSRTCSKAGSRMRNSLGFRSAAPSLSAMGALTKDTSSSDV